MIIPDVKRQFKQQAKKGSKLKKTFFNNHNVMTVPYHKNNDDKSAEERK